MANQLEIVNFLGRPGMYLHTVNYDSVCAFLLGYDVATAGGFLAGFEEFLICELSQGFNLSWPELVLSAIFPDHQNPRDVLSSTAGTEKALAGLRKLLEIYWGLRDSQDGLRNIFFKYGELVRAQTWYAAQNRENLRRKPPDITWSDFIHANPNASRPDVLNFLKQIEAKYGLPPTDRE